MANQSLSSPTGSVFRCSTSSEEEDELNCAFISDEFIRTLSATDNIESSSSSSEKAHITGFPENTHPVYDAAATVESMYPETLCSHKLKLQSQKGESHEILPNIIVNFKSYRRFGGRYLPNFEDMTINNMKNRNSNDSEDIETSSCCSLAKSLTNTSYLSLKTSPSINIPALKISENSRPLHSEKVFQLLNNSSCNVSGPTSEVAEINGYSTDASAEENFNQISTSNGLNILKQCHPSSKPFQFLNKSSIFNESEPGPTSEVAEINGSTTDAAVDENFKQISTSDGLNILKQCHSSSNDCLLAKNQEIDLLNSTTSKDQSLTEADKHNMTASFEECNGTSDFTSTEMLKRMIMLMAPGKALQIPLLPKRFLTVYNELSTILEDDSAYEGEPAIFLQSNSVLSASSTNKLDSKLRTSRKSFLKDTELVFNNETILKLLEEPGILEESDLTLMSNTEMSQLRIQKDNCPQLSTSMISFLQHEESCFKESGKLEESDLTFFPNIEVSSRHAKLENKDNCYQLSHSMISFLQHEKSCMNEADK